MESHLAFQIGQAPKLTKEQIKKEKLRKLREKQKKNRPPYHSVPIRPLWRIVPCAREDAFIIDTLSGDTYITKAKSLSDYGRFWKETKSDLFPSYTPDAKIIESIQNAKKRCKKIMHENQVIRWKFKRFVTSWRLKKFREINDTDFITLNAIQNPIGIPNFELRTLSLFDASSLITHIHRQLLHHDGPIPEALFPKNPYTNSNFTLGQLIHIRNECKLRGQSIWTLEAFAKNKYNLNTFLQYNRKQLRMHAMKSILYSYKDYDGIDTLMNFIESQHEEHNANFQKSVYQWFLHHMPEEGKISKWRSLCKEYYEHEILAEDDTGRDDAFFRIRVKTGGLCGPPHDLVAKRTLFLRMKKDGNGSVSV